MATVQIPDALDNALQQAAERLGRSKDDLVREAQELHLEDQSEAYSNFTPAQIERMRHSISQLERGEVVTSEEVDAFFDNWRKQLAAK